MFVAYVFFAIFIDPFLMKSALDIDKSDTSFLDNSTTI